MNLDWSFQTSSVQTFQPKIVIYKGAILCNIIWDVYKFNSPKISDKNVNLKVGKIKVARIPYTY